MALVIEDGSGRSDATSFASVDDLRAYATQRGASVPKKDADCEVVLIKAMDAIRWLAANDRFKGLRVYRAQALPFPRVGIIIDGFGLDSNVIPADLINGQCALAIEAQTVDLLPTDKPNAVGPVTSKSVSGAVSVTYADPGRRRTVPAVLRAESFLGTLLKSGSAVYRA